MELYKGNPQKRVELGFGNLGLLNILLLHLFSKIFQGNKNSKRMLRGVFYKRCFMKKCFIKDGVFY